MTNMIKLANGSEVPVDVFYGWGHQKQRMSLCHPLKGQRHSKETRAKIGEANKGKSHTPWNKGLTGVFSEEALAKISAAGRGRVDTPETRARRSAAVKGKKKNRSPEGNAKLCKKIVTPLGEFPSVKAAAEAHNFPGGWTIQKLTKKSPTEYYYI